MVRILYEDSDLLVCVKPCGVVSEAHAGNGLPELLCAQYRQAGKPDEVATVHRLDRNVGGLMLLSRRKAVTGKLIAQFAAHEVEKEYLAVGCGVPQPAEGVFEDLLFRDARHNKSYVVHRMRKGVREAKLSYRVLGTAQHEGKALSLVLVRLYTGRTHQIRVQFASRAMPLLGDVRYGSRDPACDVSLWSYHLSFRHPVSGRVCSFTCPPPTRYPWTLFELDAAMDFQRNP